MGVVLDERFLLYNLSSDLDHLVLEFPFQGVGMSWPEGITVDLERGDYDREFDPPHYSATLKAETHLEEKTEYEAHEEDEAAEWSARLGHELPLRLETLLRLFRSGTVWIVTERPDRDREASLRQVHVGPRPFEFLVQDRVNFSTFAEKISPVLDRGAALEWKLREAEVRRLLKASQKGVEGGWSLAYDELLPGDSDGLFARHFSELLALRWYGLCHPLEMGLRSEQALVASLIVIEALFGETRPGPKNEIRLRPAALLGLDAVEAGHLQGEIDAIYKLRNSVVHSGGFSRVVPRRFTLSPVELARRCLVIHLAASGDGLTRNGMNELLDQGSGQTVREAAIRYLGSRDLLLRVAGV